MWNSSKFGKISHFFTSVVWKNLKFLYKWRNFQISDLSCFEIWNFSTWPIFLHLYKGDRGDQYQVWWCPVAVKGLAHNNHNSNLLTLFTEIYILLRLVDMVLNPGLKYRWGLVLVFHAGSWKPTKIWCYIYIVQEPGGEVTEYQLSPVFLFRDKFDLLSLSWLCCSSLTAHSLYCHQRYQIFWAAKLLHVWFFS